ncbi:hypothetical protein KSP39_PZI004089 [Platanthera zijinensis]|uniref:Uncharacterized protein n=1 Tax=Platanthera zijinensis TaxID=2320716 RepID=A0AAP0BVZ7_9ASPA
MEWKGTFTYFYNRSYGRSQIGRIRTYSHESETCEKREEISSLVVLLSLHVKSLIFIVFRLKSLYLRVRV